MSQTRSTSTHREKELFLEALDIEDHAARARFIKDACGSDDSLRARLGRMLSARVEGDDPLDPDRYESLNAARTELAADLAGEDHFFSELGDSIRRLGDDYDLQEELGRGSAGVVFRARQISLNRDVAVKVILGAALASPTDRERFKVEAEAAASLDHPNIVPIYEVGCHETYDFYSMALVRGGTLGDRMAQRSGGAGDPREAVRLMVTLTRAVQAAHQHGIIHRDLKPDNILLDESGRPFISDFGLACRLENKNTLTLSGQIMGTPQYMAPEQADAGAGSVTTAADIYSLGAILYEMLTGVPPFRGDTVLRTLQMVRETPPRPLRAHAPSIDRDLETIVLKCLEKNPAHRYESAKALGDDLDAWLAHMPIAARPPGKVERLSKWVRRRPVHAALVATAALLLLTLSIGGPVVAWKQDKLRRAADAARLQANQERQSADNARAAADADRRIAVQEQEKATLAQAEAERSARRNQSLAYAYSTRLASIFAHQNADSLAPHAMLRAWLPTKGQTDPRGWEWYYAFADVYLVPKRIGGGAGAAQTASFSPSGQLLALSFSNSKGSLLRDALNSAVVRALNDSTGSHQQILWRSDDALVATVSSGGAAKLWDPLSGRELARVPAAENVRSISWGVDEDHLMGVTADNVIRTWDVSDPAHVRQVAQQEANIAGLTRIAVSPDGQFLAAIADGPNVFVWRTDDLTRPAQVLTGHTDTVVNLAWHHDSRWLGTTGRDEAARIWEMPAGARFVRLRGNQAVVSALAWDPNGYKLIFGGAGVRRLWVFDCPLGELVPLEKVYPAPITALGWSGNTHSVAIGLDNGQVELQRINLPDAARVLAQPKDARLQAAAFSSDGALISCLTAAGELMIIDVATGKPRGGFTAPDWKAATYAWEPSPSTALIAAAADARGSKLRRIDPATPDREANLEVDASDTLAMSLSSDRRSLALLHTNGSITLHELDASGDARATVTLQTTSAVHRHISFSPDGGTLVATGDPARIDLWNVHDRAARTLRVPASSPGPVTHTWRPDGTMLATGNSDGSISIWNVADGALVSTMRTPASTPPAVAWHPDGSRIASGGDDGATHIWDWQSSLAPLSLPASSTVTSLAWSPDGIRLTVTTADGQWMLYDATAGYLMNAGTAPAPPTDTTAP